VERSKKGYTLIERRELNGFKSLVSFIPSISEGTSYFKNKCSSYVIRRKKMRGLHTLYFYLVKTKIYLSICGRLAFFSPNHRSVMDKGGEAVKNSVQLSK
jgi:hypothetical protein